MERKKWFWKIFSLRVSNSTIKDKKKLIILCNLLIKSAAIINDKTCYVFGIWISLVHLNLRRVFNPWKQLVLWMNSNDNRHVSADIHALKKLFFKNNMLWFLSENENILWTIWALVRPFFKFVFPQTCQKILWKSKDFFLLVFGISFLFFYSELKKYSGWNLSSFRKNNNKGVKRSWCFFRPLGHLFIRFIQG